MSNVFAINQLQQLVDAVTKVGHVENRVRNYYPVNNIDVNRWANWNFEKKNDFSR